MSVAIIPMASEFGWSSSTAGLEQSAVRAGYALTQLPAGDLAAVVDLIRHEHAATLDALNARSTDLTAARDALAAQVKDLRAENRRERAETKRQRAETARERERADTLAAENELLRSTTKPRSRPKL